MGFITDLILFAFTYVVTVYQNFFAMMGLPHLGGNRPDIFNLDRRIAHRDTHPSS